VSSEGLHDALSLLLRKHENAHAHSPVGKRAILSADTARTIRRRVRFRWAGGIGAIVVVGGLGAVALAGADGGHNTPTVIASPLPTPTIGFAAATFPLTGGPEFVPASAGMNCGDPAPAPHPVDNDLSLTMSEGTSFALGLAGNGPRPSTIQALVRQVTDSDKGTVATSGIDFLVVQDGIIRGLIAGSGVGLAQNLAGGAASVPQSLLLAGGAHCSDGTHSSPITLTPGTYDVIAVGKFFSTAESVALSQALGDTINSMYLNANSQADPSAVYLPGIYNCKQARSWGSALRGCLPEITDNAAVDESAGTVTVVYRSKGLVDAFSTVLVSEPLTVDIAAVTGSPEAAAA